VILIVIQLQIRQDRRDAWLAGIAEYTANVRNEPGNISFDYYQNGDDPNEFAIIEVFRDGDAGGEHVKTAHAQQFFVDLGRWVTKKPSLNYQELPGDAWVEMGEVTPTD
jgi:quinol monooxygenase YgiN